jgi:NADP-dependent 3-hydroxy acid dehydrogenase YdfG
MTTTANFPRIWMITGATRGFGAKMAAAAIASGDAVVATGRDPAAITARFGEQPALLATALDVTDAAQSVAAVDAAVERFGRVDVLVNNAGHSSKARNIRWVGQEEWDSVLAVNLTGVYALTQAVLPGMIERGGGTIVTISSLAALRPGLIGGAPYGAAKAGVLNLMGHVHNVLREKGIRATTIMPAEVDTPILDNRPLNPDAAARATMMHADDVARAIVLCVTLPPRTVIETMVMSPTILRDQSADLKVARDAGAPRGAS